MRSAAVPCGELGGVFVAIGLAQENIQKQADAQILSATIDVGDASPMSAPWDQAANPVETNCVVKPTSREMTISKRRILNQLQPL